VAPHLGCHVSVDRVKIDIGGQNYHRCKTKGAVLWFLFLGGQNRNFVKVRGLKLQLSLFLYVSNFCMNRPFGFSVHRDALFLPKPPFQVWDLSSYFFLYICLKFLHGPPFWDFSPSRRSFLPKLPFQVCDLSSFLF